MLTPVMMDQRLKQAKIYSTFTADDWKSVNFSMLVSVVFVELNDIIYKFLWNKYPPDTMYS